MKIRNHGNFVNVFIKKKYFFDYYLFIVFFFVINYNSIDDSIHIRQHNVLKDLVCILRRIK